ncbi:DUF4832 domain-containing protein [Flavobacterium sp.]|uniref:DUF4832 domain-containing protein n=1 Tax=Flavobacterium sp. TaxID=239 RepID=UPI0035AF139A
MRKIYALLILVLLVVKLEAQTTSVSYTPSTENFSNPERGFYHHKETHSASYSALNQTSLRNYILNEKISLILRIFYLEDFINSPISASYLSNMQADFDKIRNAGIKCIVRFAYSDDAGATQRDASKEQIIAHLQQLKPLLTANADVITVVQAGFIGAWGEWYYTDHFGMNPTAADYANRKEVIDALLLAIPSNRMIQLRTPKLKQKTFLTTTALNNTQGFNGTNLARVGHHNDCFLADNTDMGTYTSVASEYPYLEQETKFTPMGGETCAFNDDRSNCATALFEMAKFHWSYMNIDYYPQVISEFSTDSCLEELKKKLGYRLQMNSATFPNSTNSGGTLPISFRIQNVGFASPFNQRKAYLVLRNVANDQEFSVQLNADPRLWLNSNNEMIVSENLTLPNTIAPGSYKLFLYLPDASSSLASKPDYSIRLANTNMWETSTGYNNLNFTLNVTSALAVIDNNILTPVIYPVPANGELIVEMENIADYKAEIYNTLGQSFGIKSNIVNNRMILNTESLAVGVYFIRLSNGQSSTTKRFIVKH